MAANQEWEFVCEDTLECEVEHTFRMKVESGWIYLHRILGGGDVPHRHIAIAMAFVPFKPKPLVRVRRASRRGTAVKGTEGRRS